MKIAILVPCYNEGLTIRKVVSDFKRVLPEADIFVYDNNSSDNTIEEATSAGAIVRTETTQGKGAVVLSMFRDIDADYYLLVDGDDTYPAEAAKKLVECIEKTNADMVIGDRLSNKTYLAENKRPFHNFGNDLVKKLINQFYHSSLNDILSGYRLFSRRFVKNYSSLISGFELETDLTIYCLNYDFKIHEIQIDYRDRPEGSVSKLNTYKDGYKVLKLFFNLYRLYKPLSFFTLISAFILLIGLILGVFPIIDYIEYQYVYKVPTAIAAVASVIIAVLLYTCGLILDNISKFDKKNFKHSLLNFDEAAKTKRY
ncbi:glycosyltransferase family 2 protein [Dysgonomonas sp. ZJ279]|uniref:glycosyltransferase family 2 protein n=1 Tax=Dysgonomonas sp. ZJ279 TaxID=2709796 RepID=UPI0013EAA2EB|nr:glycosyltransferase family 2 protein [Dysgonomonas sp. ZJ279]